MYSTDRTEAVRAGPLLSGLRLGAAPYPLLLVCCGLKNGFLCRCWSHIGVYDVSHTLHDFSPLCGAWPVMCVIGTRAPPSAETERAAVDTKCVRQSLHAPLRATSLHSTHRRVFIRALQLAWQQVFCGGRAFALI